MIVQREKPIHWAEAFGLSAAVHVGLAYLLLNTVVDLRTIFEPARTEVPELQITSLAIDTGSVTSTEPGAGGTTLAAPETLAPVAPVDAILEPITPVSPQPDTAPDQVAAVTTPQRVAPVSNAITPPPVSALRPEVETVAPVSDTATPEPVTPDPVTPDDTTSPSTDPATAAAPASPQPPASPAPSQPAEPDPVAADLINRIRESLGETCLIAIPQQAADGTVGLTIYAADEDVVGPYADDILADLTPRPDLQTVLIDPRQCAALDYIRQSAAYPTSPLTLSLDATRITSGEPITGRLSGTGGRNITLVIVDDNGVTQDLGQYLNVAVNTARFEAPLRRAGVARDTRQLLLAIATPARPATVTTQNGQLAEDYFAALTAEIGANAPIVLVPFDVR